MKIKINSRHLISLIKLNYNCPETEKQGEGPGSCSGTNLKIDSSQQLIVDQLNTILKDSTSEAIPYNDSLGNVWVKLIGADGKKHADVVLSNEYTSERLKKEALKLSKDLKGLKQSVPSSSNNIPSNISTKSKFDRNKFGLNFKEIYNKDKNLRFAVDSYVMNSDINSFLGNKTEYIKSLKDNNYSDKAIAEDIQIKNKFISSMDSMFNSPELADHPDITMLRGINSNLLENIISNTPDILKVGTEFKNTPYMSVTSSKKMQKFFTESMYGDNNKPTASVEIIVPKGVPIAYFGNKFSELYPDLAENAGILNTDIQEWLLPRDLKVTVVSVNKVGNNYNMKWKISRK